MSQRGADMLWRNVIYVTSTILLYDIHKITATARLCYPTSMTFGLKEVQGPDLLNRKNKQRYSDGGGKLCR